MRADFAPKDGKAAMTNEELATLLEGLHRHADARLAVALPGMPPVEMTIVGAASGKSLGLPLGGGLPGAVWLLSGAVIGPLPPWWWLPRHRHQP